jgi:transposase
MKRLGVPVSDDTILRHLKRQVARCRTTKVRVAGIDDWSWRKGHTYGTIIVDLERREVVDLLQDRTATGTAEWLGRHPEIEIVSRDRCGLYAEGARAGASQARQVADRFHLLQNLRETIEAQLSRVGRPTGRALLPECNDEHFASIVSGPGNRNDVAEHRRLTRQAHRRSRQAIFDQIHSLRKAGNSIAIVARETGFRCRTIRKWLKCRAPPERRASAPKTCSPHHFFDYLSRRWAEGCVRGRQLFQEVKLRGYTGSFSHLERLLAKWRRANDAKISSVLVAEQQAGSKPQPAPRVVDPATGWTITPIVAASLCIKPGGLLTPNQAAKVDALKTASPEFATMRRLAMWFRGILRSKDLEKFNLWLNDAQQCGIYAMQRFARTVRRDFDAVKNALTEEWSNGQTEGHINRLKTLKRAMYGRAGTELLRARMLPLRATFQHGN